MRAILSSRQISRELDANTHERSNRLGIFVSFVLIRGQLFPLSRQGVSPSHLITMITINKGLSSGRSQWKFELYPGDHKGLWSGRQFSGMITKDCGFTC